jgi:hypothetical protein
MSSNEVEMFLEKMSDYVDPFGPISIVEHEGFLVARDDLMEYGSKARFANWLVANCPQKNLIYGGAPAQGYAPISLGHLSKIHNKKALIFSPARSEKTLLPQQRKAIELGCEFHWVKTYGSMAPCIKAAREYANTLGEDAVWLPLGLDHPAVIAAIAKIAGGIGIKPKRVFSVAGSGTLSRGLQRAFPNSEIHAVQTGKTLTKETAGRAIVHVSPYSFNQKVKKEEMTPFPSIASYDAKAWSFLKKYGEPGDLMWNVAGPLD